MTSSLVQMSVLMVAFQACYGKQIVYGKYFSKTGDTSDNSIFLFKPSGSSVGAKLPLVLDFHPGGFISGSPTTSADDTINAYLNKGFAFASVGYRVTTTKYYYGADNKTEELVRVSPDGELSLDTTGKTMEDYTVRIGRQECITKYIWDVEQMIEYIIDNQDTLGVDPQRILTSGSSAGGAGINHLTWVYHKRNVGRYTPRGIMYTSAQLNYPVDNMLDHAWNLFVDDIGGDVKLSDIVSQSACSGSVGNSMCSTSLRSSNGVSFPPPGPITSDYNLCNMTWHNIAIAKYCGDAYNTSTIGELAASQVWPREDPEVGLGMEKLWYTSENMQLHQPKPFHMYIANDHNGTGSFDIPHEALYARNYAKYAEKAGVNFTVYYTDYAHMKDADLGTERVESSGNVWNYRSSHNWRTSQPLKDVEVASTSEQVLFACMAVDLDCSTEHMLVV